MATQQSDSTPPLAAQSERKPTEGGPGGGPRDPRAAFDSPVKVSSSPSAGYDTIVLSGGAIRGIAILGAIQFATDNGLLTSVNTFIGTSSGAMICYLLSIGYTSIEIMVYLCTHQLLERMQSLNIVALLQGRGALSFNNLSEHLERMTINKIGYLPTMQDIRERYGKTFICATHNLTEQRTEYIGPDTHPRVPCITAIRMSANLPLVFERFKYGHCLYVDGAISDNFPIQLADKPGKKVLGILLGKNLKKLESGVEQNTLEYIYQLMFIPIDQSVKYKVSNASDRCKIVQIALERTSTGIKFFDFNIPSTVKLDMFTQGYEAMKKECL